MLFFGIKKAQKMTSVRIVRRKNEDRYGDAQLYAEFYLQREKVRIPVGLKVSRAEWDAKSMRVAGRSQMASDKNLIIEGVLSRITDVFVKARLSDEKLTRAEFLKRYNKPQSGGMDFTTFLDKYYVEVRPRLKYNTLKVHKMVIKKLKYFKDHITFSDLTVDFLNNWVAWLRKARLAETTVWKQTDVLKVYVMAADRKGYLKDNPFKNFRTRKPKAKIVYLDEQELSSLVELFNAGTLSDARQRVLRFFLFMAFTSMHVGDARLLRIEDIYAGEIHYNRIKTLGRVSVPLNASAQKLIDYYRDGRTRGTLILGLPSDQKINKLLKEICLQVGIEKAVSCKTARHTFATLWTEKTNDVLTLRDVMGHSSISTTMVYAHVVEAKRLAGSKVFDNFL